MKRYISIDIGGTAIKYGIIGGDGKILSRSTMKTEAQRGGPAILDTVLGIAGQLSSKEKISGICISTAGMVDVEKGAITYAAPLIPIEPAITSNLPNVPLLLSGGRFGSLSTSPHSNTAASQPVRSRLLSKKPISFTNTFPA